MTTYKSTLFGECSAEFLGTFLLVLVGDGAGAVAVFTGAYDLTGVALVWGVGVALAIYVAGGVSGAHLNPAVTVTFAAFRGFSWRKVPAFIAAQVAGAFTAALALYVCWHGFWAPTASRLGVAVGQPGSQKLLMVFSCFYPNPGSVGTTAADLARVSTGAAFLTEAILTLFLLVSILAVVDTRNGLAPRANLAPLFVGLCVTAIVGIGAPLTMDAVNPARDFGPRLLGYLLGYGHIAFPGPRGNEWWLYILAPICGGLAGGAAYDRMIRPYLIPPGPAGDHG